jgi:hypothetical protein
MMPDGMYSVSALIPQGTDFSVAKAIEHFRSLGLRSEPAEPERVEEGFRVFFDDWAIVAWYSQGEKVLRDSRELAESDYKPFPVPPEVIASCDRDLALWSDEDWDAHHTDEWIDFVDELIRAFPGVVVFDYVMGEWW